MATVTKGRTFVSGETVTPTKLNELVDNATVTAIQTADISDSQITTAKIADANVTTAKIADANVTTAKIADANVTAAKIANNAVETAKINNAAITAAKLDGAQTGSAPIYGCRAWVNFDGTTGAIRGQGNVSSVTRNAVGNYTVSFATAMTDTNYAVIATADNPESTTTTWSVGPIFQGTGGVQLLVQNSGGVNSDRATVSVAIFR